MPLNSAHLEALIEISTHDQNWVGSNVANWSADVFDFPASKLDHVKKLNRVELKSICSERSGYSDNEVFAAVMGWGGMRRDHGRLIVKYIEGVCSVISSIRNGDLSRKQSFAAFHQLRNLGELPGMTAAYFTKLIFFCSPCHDGYIMDQWTSKSVNLLYDDAIVDLNKAGFVTDANDSDRYESFCLCVEELAKRAGWGFEETEVRLFSEGRNKGAWRRYVKENWH